MQISGVSPAGADDSRVGFRIVGENFGVAAPIQRGFDLLLAPPLRKNVRPEHRGKIPAAWLWSDLLSSALAICCSSVTRASSGLAEQIFSASEFRPRQMPCRFGVISTSPRGRLGETKQRRGFDDGQQIVHFHQEIFGNVV